MKLNPGDSVYVDGEKRPYTVRCRSRRYIICTKPYSLQNTVMYFILDLKDRLRGPDDQIFCAGYETDGQCMDRLRELQTGKIRLSARRSITLDVDAE